MHAFSCWTWLILIVGMIVSILAIAFSAWLGLGVEAGLVAEDEFAFTLSLWTFIWGIVLFVTLLVFSIDGCMRSYAHNVTGPGKFSWFWGLLTLFIVGPWNVLGHVFLLRGWTSNGDASTAVFAIAIAALVITWIIFVAFVRYLALITFVHTSEIGMNRDLTSLLNLGQGSKINKEHFDLPLIMTSMIPTDASHRA